MILMIAEMVDLRGILSELRDVNNSPAGMESLLNYFHDQHGEYAC